jgi:hypothetical protein
LRASLPDLLLSLQTGATYWGILIRVLLFLRDFA